MSRINVGSLLKMDAANATISVMAGCSGTLLFTAKMLWFTSTLKEC